jgi:hypothetical protein
LTSGVYILIPGLNSANLTQWPKVLTPCGLNHSTHFLCRVHYTIPFFWAQILLVNTGRCHIYICIHNHVNSTTHSPQQRCEHSCWFCYIVFATTLTLWPSVSYKGDCSSLFADDNKHEDDVVAAAAKEKGEGANKKKRPAASHHSEQAGAVPTKKRNSKKGNN